MMTNLMTILERKAFISSNPRIVLSSCPPPCGHFSIQESATGGLSYKVKKDLPSLQKGPKGFGGTTLISTVPKCLHIARSSSDNAGKTPYFNCTELRGRFHNLRTESSHHTDSSLGLLLMYYSLHRHRYFAFGFILCEISGCVKGENPNVIPLL